MKNPMTVSNNDEVDAYLVGNEVLLSITQRRHMSNQSRMSTRAFLNAKEARQLATELIAEADRIDAQTRGDAA